MLLLFIFIAHGLIYGHIYLLRKQYPNKLTNGTIWIKRMEATAIKMHLKHFYLDRDPVSLVPVGKETVKKQLITFPRESRLGSINGRAVYLIYLCVCYIYVRGRVCCAGFVPDKFAKVTQRQRLEWRTLVKGELPFGKSGGGGGSRRT